LQLLSITKSQYIAEFHGWDRKTTTLGTNWYSRINFLGAGWVVIEVTTGKETEFVATGQDSRLKLDKANYNSNAKTKV
jgi:hypothetical protein